MNKLNFILALVATMTLNFAHAQNQTSKTIDSFDKVIVGPHIEVVLIKSDTEGVAIGESSIPEDKINIVVKGKTLRLYLDQAKVTAKTEKVDEPNWKGRRSIYYNKKAQITVYYKSLRGLSIRGEEDATCAGQLEADKFRLKIYGESKVKLEKVKLDQLKVRCYGEVELVIESGQIDRQKYTMYGESEVDAVAVFNNKTKIVSYGESEFKLAVQDRLKVTALGESEVSYAGDANLKKGIILGENEIQKIQ